VETEGFNTKYTDLDAMGSDRRMIRNSTVENCENECNRYGCPAFVMDFRQNRNNCWIKDSGINGITMVNAPGVNTYNISATLNSPKPPPPPPTVYKDLDAMGSDSRMIQNSTVEKCENECRLLGNKCPAFVMDFRQNRNNCWIKHSGINGITMVNAPGVNTYNISATLNCPSSQTSISKISPKSDPSKEIVLTDWDVDQIKLVHSKYNFNVTDSEMPLYIEKQIQLGSPYYAVDEPNTAVTNQMDGSNGCPLTTSTVTQKWMFNDYDTMVNSYLRSNITNYITFLNMKGFRDQLTQTFTTMEGFKEGNVVQKNNVTQGLVQNNGQVTSTTFVLNNTKVQEYTSQFNTYVNISNQSIQNLTTKFTKLGIKDTNDYLRLLDEMGAGVGFVNTEWATWFVDILPVHNVVDATTMAKFRDNMKKGIYINFGFGKPKEPTIEKRAHEIYFWYLSELSKLGVGVYEMEGFSTTHSTMFSVKMNMSSQMEQSPKSQNLWDVFPADPFLQLVPIYKEMGFDYKSSSTQEGNKKNFIAFCSTVNNIGVGTLIDRLKLFSDRIKQYGMSSFMEYITFMNELTSTVGTVGDLVEMMDTVKKYINETSGLKSQLGNTYKTGKVTLSNGTQVDIFDYKIVKWFINNNLMQNNNKYGVSNDNGISFTKYVTTLNKQNWTYGNTMTPTMNANANYVESEKRGNTIANKTYKSISYNPDTDPFKIKIKQPFGGMDTDDYNPGWIGQIGDWVSNLFSSDKEGLTNNTLSDHETLKQFGVSDTNKQLPPIIETFKTDYDVTDFNEMIFYISCLRRVGVSSTDLIPTPGTISCLQLLIKYRIDKSRVDVFTQHMKNAGFKYWGGPYGLRQFIMNTSDFGVNQDVLNYKQFVYIMRKFGCNFNISGHIELLYGFMWLFNFLLNIKYNNSGKIAPVTFQPSSNVKGAKSSEYTNMWKKYVEGFAYSKRDDDLQQMHTKDNTEYSVYMVDNFIENCLGRGYKFNGQNFNQIISSIIIPMYILNKSEASKNKYPKYQDLFIYINIKNPPFLPVDTYGKVMDLGQYLWSTIMPNHPNPNIFYDIIHFILQNLNLSYTELEKMLVDYTNTKLLNLTQQPNYPNKDKYELPYKIKDMISFVYEDEMAALVDPETNKSKYNEMFGSDDKIIEYMMDMVIGMKQWLDDIAKTKPVDSDKYNDIIPTANAIILYPIYMFRWMEQQIQLNKPQCTEDKRKKLENQNQCYQTIPSSQMGRKRASYVEPTVVLSSTR
jgi:hypothetical protein